MKILKKFFIVDIVDIVEWYLGPDFNFNYWNSTGIDPRKIFTIDPYAYC